MPVAIINGGTAAATDLTITSSTGGGGITVSGTMIYDSKHETWQKWNDVYIKTCTSTACGASNVWTIWNDEYNSATTTTITGGGTGSTARIIYTPANHAQVWGAWHEEHTLTREQQELRAQQRLRQQQEWERTRQQRETERIRVEGEQKLARERAAILLQESLSERQRAELRDKGYFSLETIDSKTGQRRRYQIAGGRGQHGNVYQVDESGKRIYSFCIQPRERVPDEDAMLAQKLMLEHCEEDFLKIANRSRY